MSFLPFDPDAVTVSERSRPVAVPAPVEKGVARPLSNWQKWKLSELSGSVYEFLSGQGGLVGESAEAFRHRIAEAACGRRISAAGQGDFKRIQAAFLEARGAVEAAARARQAAAMTPLRIAVHKLWELCARTNTPRQAAQTIAGRFYKGARVEDLTTPKQVWSVFYTVQNNANAAAGVGSKANRFKSRRSQP